MGLKVLSTIFQVVFLRNHHMQGNYALAEIQACDELKNKNRQQQQEEQKAQISRVGSSLEFKSQNLGKSLHFLAWLPQLRTDTTHTRMGEAWSGSKEPHRKAVESVVSSEPDLIQEDGLMVKGRGGGGGSKSTVFPKISLNDPHLWAKCLRMLF